MKKALALAAALTLALTLPAAAFAADLGPDHTSGTADVTLDVMPSYTVTIPTEVALAAGEDGTYAKDAVVSASNVRLAKDYEIQVSLTGDFTMQDSWTQTEWQYAVTAGDSTEAVKNGDIVARFATGAGASDAVSLHFTAAPPEYAGNYTDTITFTIAMKKQAG